ncbi:TDP-N-acetylfucosamine:lipid II N-acetylfucosaminyltransferase [Kineosporia sp. NBRC 101731]|uniref:TDP-N-acetylfucosamine:lipid II N-acetylfucosaminyltransferase n=1 Tax=Kineosporia sp. NBRC 101731 TaxID=3032199 RepID=UPI0024A0F773|nr:TDP-N-acetylfucosamine:lipid II N-acetylfucosaminyltransferase [Kineosporia sp. NBRC 101731]GLY29213.1 hypothetical protein Kisp02_25780 [Kineosporia sp. NBRC 101731]
MIHVLGSDIPHHNATVLAFFDEMLAPELDHRPQFWVAGEPPGHYPNLDVRVLRGRAAVTRAVARRAMLNRRERFFLHGQFSSGTWTALLLRLVRPDQVSWHIWGGDLHETRPGRPAALAYRMRRLAHRRVGHVYGTLGDLDTYSRRHPRTPVTPLYFPGPHASFKPSSDRQRPRLTVLIGNSGDPSNRHVEALRAVHDRFGPATRVLLPTAHPAGNQTYLNRVQAEAALRFGADNVEMITGWTGLEQFSARIGDCDLAYLPARRQQGVGTLYLLLRQGVPVVLHRENGFTLDLARSGVPFLTDDNWDDAALVRCREALAGTRVEVAPFAPGRQPWLWSQVVRAPAPALPAFSFDAWFTLLFLITSYLGIPLSWLLVRFFDVPAVPAGAAGALPVLFYAVYRAVYAALPEGKHLSVVLTHREADLTVAALASLAIGSLAAFVARNGLLLLRIGSYRLAFSPGIRLVPLKRFTYYLIPAALIAYLRHPTRARWLAFAASTTAFGALTYVAVGGTRANLAVAVALTALLGASDGHLPAQALPALGAAGLLGMYLLALGRYRDQLSGLHPLNTFLFLTRDTFSPWEHLALIVRRRAQIEHQGLAPILRDFQVFVPRRLWPGRPDITLNTAKYFTWRVNGGERVTSLSPTLIGSSWIMGGPAGVLAGAAATGLIMRAFDHLLESSARPRERPGDAVLAGFALASVFNVAVLVREGLDSFVSRTVVQAGVFGAGVGVARRMSRRLGGAAR